MPKKINVFLSAEQIQKRVAELAAVISRDFAGHPLHCVGILKGSFIFMSDLVRNLTVDVTCDFLTLSSYGTLTQTSGVVKLVTDLTTPIGGKDVLIIEDIVDSGLTLKYLLDNLSTRNPRSLKLCALLDKPEGRRVQVPVDYTGFIVPNKFLIGYGLDDAEFSRNLPYIAAVDPE